MRVRIEFVVDKGDLDNERLVLRVLRDADIGDYMLIRTGFEGGQVTTEVSNTFWFPNNTVNRGDFVVVYSKSGKSTTKPMSDGCTMYFFYWEQTSPLWNDERFAPVLLYAPQWVGKAPQELVRQSSSTAR